MDPNQDYNRISSQAAINLRAEQQRQKNLTPDQKTIELLLHRVALLEKSLFALENQIVEVTGLGAHATAGTLKGGVHIVLPSGANATCTGSNTLQLTFF